MHWCETVLSCNCVHFVAGKISWTKSYSSMKSKSFLSILWDFCHLKFFGRLIKVCVVWGKLPLQSPRQSLSHNQLNKYSREIMAACSSSATQKRLLTWWVSRCSGFVGGCFFSFFLDAAGKKNHLPASFWLYEALFSVHLIWNSHFVLLHSFKMSFPNPVQCRHNTFTQNSKNRAQRRIIFSQTLSTPQWAVSQSVASGLLR